MAAEVLELVERLPTALGEERVWRLATRAEAKLLLGEAEDAKMLYQQAAHDPDCSVQGRETMKDQVNRILRKPPREGLKPGDWDSLFEPPEPSRS
jgi:hypothetical protein